MADSLYLNQNSFDQKYHLALSLEDQTCVIIGLGAVGQRKLAGLLKTNVAQIKIFDPYIADSRIEELRNPKIAFYKRKVNQEDLLAAILVFPCTNDKRENEQIAAFCQKHRILCNCTTDPAKGQVEIPSVISRDGLTLTISTSGGSPALSKKWRLELSQWVGKRILMVKLMRELRPKILRLGLKSEQNSQLFRQLAYSKLEEYLMHGKLKEAIDLLYLYLPKEIHDQIPEIQENLSQNEP